MSNTGGFYSLIRPVEKREGRLERLRIVSVGANGDTRMGGPPTFKLQPWTTLGVATQTDAHLDVGELALRDAALSANFKVRFTARAHIDPSDKFVRELARAFQTQKGLAGFIEDYVRQAIERWPDARKSEKGRSVASPVIEARLLTAISKHGGDAALYVAERLREIGIVAVEPRLYLVAWHEGRVDIDEKAGLEIRVTDGDPVIVRIASFIDKDPNLAEAFYTSSLHRYKLAGQGASISEKVMVALKTGLDGKFSRQQWTANDKQIQAAAKAAMNAVAAVYGRAVQQLILTTSVRKPDEIINFDRTYDYRITGVNRSLKVQHRGAVQRFDAGLYETLAKNDPTVRDIPEFVLKRIHDETERFLQSKSYKEAVELLVDKERRDELQHSVQLRVEQTLQQYGLQLQSFSTVVQDLPERPLLSGWELDLEPKEYRLSVHDRIANLGVIATLKLVEPEQIVPHIIQRSGDAQGDNVAGQTDHLMGLVTRAVEAAIAAYVITITPDQYLESDLANEQNRMPDGPSYKDELQNRIQTKLRSEFGIALSGAFTLRRGGDPATQRVYELQNRHRRVAIPAVKRSINSGEEESFEISVSYRILGPSKDHLGVFNSKAIQPIDVQLGDMDTAIEDLFATLVRNAKTMEEFSPARLTQVREGPNGLDAEIVQILAAEHGVTVTIDKYGVYSSIPDLHTATPLQSMIAAHDRLAKQLLTVYDVPVEDLPEAQAKAQQIQTALKVMNEQIQTYQADEADKRIHGTAVERQLRQLPPAIADVSRPAGPALTDQSGAGAGKPNASQPGAGNGAGLGDVIEGQSSVPPERTDQPASDT